MSQIDVSDTRDVVVLLDDSPRCCTWATAVRRALKMYLELAPTLAQQFKDVDSVDLRFDERAARWMRPRSTQPNMVVVKGKAKPKEDARRRQRQVATSNSGTRNDGK